MTHCPTCGSRHEPARIEIAVEGYRRLVDGWRCACGEEHVPESARAELRDDVERHRARMEA